uniref:Uncharacterized protein n=1 Tax=Romanomermis culicivorax TaxID=13658 RepID=A0A915IGU3_ROMCU
MEQEWVFREGYGGPSKRDVLVREWTKEEKSNLITGRRPLHQDSSSRRTHSIFAYIREFAYSACKKLNLLAALIASFIDHLPYLEKGMHHCFYERQTQRRRILKKRICSWRIIHMAQMHSAHITMAHLKIGAIGQDANGKAQMKSAHVATNLEKLCSN